MFSETLVQGFSGPFLGPNHHEYADPPFLPVSESPNLVSPSSSSEGDSSKEGDSSDATLTLISQMLMEEDDLEDKPCMFQESLALQATEKSFYDVLGQKYPPSETQNHSLSDLCKIADSPDDDASMSRSCSSGSITSSVSLNDFGDSTWVQGKERIERSFYAGYTVQSVLQSIRSIKDPNEPAKAAGSISQTNQKKNSSKGDNLSNGSREKKSHNREVGDYTDVGRKSKQLASSAEGLDEVVDMFDEVLLCPRLNPHLHPEPPVCFGKDDEDEDTNGISMKLPLNGRTKRAKNRNKRQGNNKDLVDLTTLLIQCAQAVASCDIRNADELLKKIRQHSSPHGDGTERAAHYFANALDARLAGTGTALYTAFATRAKGILAADLLKGYQVYVKASPFNKMSNLFANLSIGKVAEKATRLHIIDFGIMYGFQYPCLIQHLSVRPGGPPKLRITGIDFPQLGFRPAGRIEATGRRLATYCQRFNVPFEYSAIAKKWETIELTDIKIEEDEVLVVNCLHRLRNVPDETVVETCPRDDVLNLVKRINPDMFIFGVLTGSYNTPFFVTRFKEALFNFCSRFDMFDATVPREEWGRILFERELYGRDIMNVVACEGSERVERPENYKQWQVRSMRAGFRQVQLDAEMVKNVSTKVKAHYHKDFVIDEDDNWLLQGWKGKIIYASSCWKPIN